MYLSPFANWVYMCYRIIEVYWVGFFFTFFGGWGGEMEGVVGENVLTVMMNYFAFSRCLVTLRLEVGVRV